MMNAETSCSQGSAASAVNFWLKYMPPNSKTMMAAFIIAIKGTVRQAVMLGLAATLSHTAIEPGIALLK
jgi:hypothetical protein